MSTFSLLADRISRAVVNTEDSWNGGFLVHLLKW